MSWIPFLDRRLETLADEQVLLFQRVVEVHTRVKAIQDLVSVLDADLAQVPKPAPFMPPHPDQCWPGFSAEGDIVIQRHGTLVRVNNLDTP